MKNGSIWTLVFALGFLFTFPTWARPPLSTAKVAVLEGKAWNLHSGKELPLEVGNTVSAGDTVRTDAKSKLILLFSDRAATWIKGDSQIKLEEVHRRSIKMNLEKGAILSQINSKTPIKTKFAIRTKAAVMGVRGTTFFLKDEPKKPLLFCACEGTVAVSSDANSKTTDFTTQHHDSPRLIELGTSDVSERMTPPPAGTDYGHSDSEIAELRALLSRK